MFSESAELYDAIYGAFKDYGAEAASLATLVHRLRPGARRVLDVGCGTGEHAKRLRADHGFEVDGLDLDPGLLAIARLKVPGALFVEADMSGFALERRYDAVTCLFGSIGYVRTLHRLVGALSCFRAHLAPSGVILVEPWFAPGVLVEGPGPVTRATAGNLKVERKSRVTLQGSLSRLLFDYEIDDGQRMRSVREVHELGLFSQGEMMSAFAGSGLAVSYDPFGLTGRGVYVAEPAARPAT